MARFFRRPGTTLLESIVVIATLGVLLGLGYPAMGRGLDSIAVRSARDSLGAGVRKARSTALARGGASLIVDLEGGRFWVETAAGDMVGMPIDLGSRYRVGLSTTGAAADLVEIRFDAVGIGRFANRTFQVSRGRAQAHLTLSSHGRPRPW